MSDKKDNEQPVNPPVENIKDTSEKSQTPLRENFSISKTDDKKDQETLNLLTQIVKKGK